MITAPKQNGKRICSPSLPLMDSNHDPRIQSATSCR
jgi:hypothetical protein